MLLLLVALSLLSSSYADAADPFLDSFAKPPALIGNSLDYAGQIAPMHGMDGPNTTPSVMEQQLRGTLLLHKDAVDVWSLNVKGALFFTSSQFVIPTEQAVPQDLWDVSVGVAYNHKIDEKHDDSVKFDVGSASDVPYVIRDMFVSATYAHKFPCWTQSCIFFVNESTNRTFANFIPIPGIAYVIHDPENGLDAVLGLPFAFFNYRAARHWSLRGALLGPTSVTADVAYLPVPKLPAVQIYSSFNWGQQLWSVENRPSYATRLFYDRKKTGLGFRAPVSRQINLDFFTGWEFSRRFYQGTNAFGGSIREGADMNPSWFAQVKLGIYSL
jgi:hypothetical protein